MKILIIGSGGREHALAWQCAQSPHQPELFFAPGNPGMAKLGQRLDIDPMDFAGLVLFAKREQMDLTLVGPEAPLSGGIVDAFEAAGLPIFGPSRAAAQMESSKAFAKEIMRQGNVPTAGFRLCHQATEALATVAEFMPPYVLKQDGLAAGKGVFICPTRSEAEAVIHRHFAEGQGALLVEEFLSGQEISVFAVCDGERAIPMLPAQDHKRAGEGDTGPNTGGMGAYASVPWVTGDLMDRIQKQVFTPVLQTLKANNMPYKGLLYAGLMISATGEPSVVEFNCRFGDPETQVLLPLLATDIVNLLMASAKGDLSSYEASGILFKPRLSAVTVVLCAKGYPGTIETGKAITLPEVLPHNTLLFHAGTSINRMVNNGETLLSKGGRVLNAVGLGPTLESAIESAYALADAVAFEGKQLRRDIGQKGLHPFLQTVS